MTDKNLYLYTRRTWCTKPELQTCIHHRTIDIPKQQSINPLFLKYPFEGDCYAISHKADLKYSSILLKNGNSDIDISRDEPLTERHKKFIRDTVCYPATIDGILKFLCRANPQMSPADFTLYTWMDILSALRQAQKAGITIQAADATAKTEQSGGAGILVLPEVIPPTPEQKAILQVINKWKKPPTLTNLERDAELGKTIKCRKTLHNTVKPMEESGLIARPNGRNKGYVLTEKGIKTLNFKEYPACKSM